MAHRVWDGTMLQPGGSTWRFLSVSGRSFWGTEGRGVLRERHLRHLGGTWGSLGEDAGVLESLKLPTSWNPLP